jgi:formylglycine-generating enzyme required for sulfatase activity
MKRAVLVAFLSTFAAGSALTETCEQSCERTAVDRNGRPLAGAARNAFMQKCKLECGQGAATSQSYALTAEAERALEAGKSFRECAQGCPEMIVVPAGEFLMGSDRNDEGPRHKVKFARPFAVSKFEITFDEWDGCAARACYLYRPGDRRMGRGTRPVINVSWYDAQMYVAWLYKMSGKSYRLLSEAEWEYAARAGTQTAYSWGDEIGKGNANCTGCGSRWEDDGVTAPVGSFAANAFGLHDMHGNVFEWVQDCYYKSYDGAPMDGSPNNDTVNCNRVARGGSFLSAPEELALTLRVAFPPGLRATGLGFRVARTLLAP